MEHCVFAAFLSTGKDHRVCGRPYDIHKIELRDRVGAAFPVLPDTGCRNTVFNSVPQLGAEYIGRLKNLGVNWFRVDLLRESPAEIEPLLDRYEGGDLRYRRWPGDVEETESVEPVGCNPWHTADGVNLQRAT
jgi:putative protease